MPRYKVLQLNKTNWLSIKFHLLVNFPKKFNLLLKPKEFKLMFNFIFSKILTSIVVLAKS